MKIYWMHVPIDMVGVSCFGVFRRCTLLGASCLEFTGSDKIRSCVPVFFLRLFDFRGRVTKLCWLLSSCGMFSHSMVKLAGEKCHERRDLGTSNGDLTLCGNDELAG
jgi:hypothetical protein